LIASFPFPLSVSKCLMNSKYLYTKSYKKGHSFYLAKGSNPELPRIPGTSALINQNRSGIFSVSVLVIFIFNNQFKDILTI
jgi:hypothetical protein